jgi:transcriptional regulator with XRE-family HTH domain
MSAGERLREARVERGLSLRALGERTGFSASFLSQVERGTSSPSLASLEKIAAALDLTVSRLLATPADAGPILRRSAREPLRSEWSKVTMESLTRAHAGDDVEGFLLQLDPGGSTGASTYRPRSRVFAYCTRGQVGVLHEKIETMALDEGDSIVLAGPVTVAWENSGPTAAELLLVVMRPLA